MMTFLDLVNSTIRELGINGGVPLASVAAPTNTQDALRIVSYVADADMRIQSLYNDWSFMWRSYAGSITSGSVLGLPRLSVDNYVFRLLDRDTLWINPGTTTAYQPAYMEWRAYTRLYQPANVIQVSQTPNAWSQAPNKTLYISTSATTTLNYNIEGYAKPYRMRSDGDVSPIVRFLASHPINKILIAANLANQVVQAYAGPTALTEQDVDGRIIIARAKMIYAEVEGALEVMQGAMAEYEDILKELQSIGLLGQESDWQAQADIPETIDPFCG